MHEETRQPLMINEREEHATHSAIHAKEDDPRSLIRVDDPRKHDTAKAYAWYRSLSGVVAGIEVG